MAELFLSQAEGDELLALSKIFIGKDEIDLPDRGGSLDLSFSSQNGREEFVLNYTRHSINLSKRNHHLRGRRVVGLARLDLDGPPHRNPDGEEIGARHLHLYREGYGLKWAFEIPENSFSNLDNAFETLEDFMRFCNVIKMPNLRRSLFS
jgi:hypothetical protein